MNLEVRSKQWHLLLVGAAFLVLSGCRHSTEVEIGVSTHHSRDLGPGDELEVRVRDHDELTGTYQISNSGTIRFPHIGIVSAASRSPDDVAAEIEERLSDGWLRRPSVAVAVRARQNREVSVLGEVNEPGSYAYKERLTLVQAISIAGGLNPLARPRKVKLTRIVDGRRETTIVDVRAISEGRAEDIPLAPGDVVFVPESPI